MGQRRNSGQIVLIAAFIIASLLLAAQIYILEVGRTLSETESEFLNDFILSVQLGSRNAVLGSLANVSNGGAGSMLELNLREWSSVVGNQYLNGKSILDYTLRGAAPYSSGMWLEWGTNGYGVSSSYSNFTHKLTGLKAEFDQSFVINITTTLLIASTNQRLGGDSRQVNVTISIQNEAEPALVKQITVYYRVSSSWLIPDEANGYVLRDYGNGTYLASFVADVPAENVEISTQIFDYRDIHVQANVTSTEI